MANAIESVNSVICKFTRNWKICPNDESALKIVYMAIHEASQKWTMSIRKRKQTFNHVAITCEGGTPESSRKRREMRRGIGCEEDAQLVGGVDLNPVPDCHLEERS